jgi:hypothetical protein
VPISITEAASAASCFPLAFLPAGSDIQPYALLRRADEGASPFVGPEGQWQAPWLPARLAAWPFDLVDAGDGHAFAVHEASDLVIAGPGGIPLFEDGEDLRLAPETARMAAGLKAHAEALPATVQAATALREHGLLTGLDGDMALRVLDAHATADLDEGCVLALHRVGALPLLHAGLVSLAHLQWMEKAERHLVAAQRSIPLSSSMRKRATAGSGFLAALAADISADDAAVQLTGYSRP